MECSESTITSNGIEQHSKFWVVKDYSTIKTLLNHKSIKIAAYGNLDLDVEAVKARESNVDYQIAYKFFKYWLISRDPHEGHTIARGLFVKFMTVAKMLEMENEVRDACHFLLDELKKELDVAESVDIVDKYASLLPSMMTAKILGFEREDMYDVKRWSTIFLIATVAKMTGLQRLEFATAAILECRAHLLEKIRQRRLNRNSNNDKSAIIKKRYLIDEVLDECDRVNANANKILIDDEDLVANFGLLMFASQDTLMMTITNSLADILLDDTNKLRGDFEAALFKTKDLKRKIGITDEYVRYNGPVDFVARYASEDIHVISTDGKSPEKIIRKGDIVLFDIYNGSNDDGVFNGKELTVKRYLQAGAPQHLGFGHGRHLCLGKNLAKVEVTIAIEEFLRYFPSGSIEIYSPDQPKVLNSKTNTAGFLSSIDQNRPKQISRSKELRIELPKIQPRSANRLRMVSSVPITLSTKSKL